MKQKVKINVEIEENYDRPLTTLNLIVDGSAIGTEMIGGEPEDNSYQRDYNWIPALMVKLAKSLGADTEINITEKST